MKTDLMQMFGLTVPILQAPIGGAATPELVMAVSRAGAMGSMALTWTPPDEAAAHIAALNSTGLVYFVNFVLRFGTAAARSALMARPPCLTLSWGCDSGTIALAKAQGVRVGVQVGSAAGAAAAIAAGADFVIAQGMEAGGHVQSTTPLSQLLPAVLAVAGPVPVVAAGGIATAAQIADCLKQGAQAVMMGTRFLATEESLAHPDYKQALVAAGGGDTSLTICFDLTWPFALHRVLRNSTLEAWEAAGHPAPPTRPGEGDMLFHQNGNPVLRYSDDPPHAGAVGDVRAGCLYAGTGVGLIDRIEPAGALVHRLWEEACRMP